MPPQEPQPSWTRYAGMGFEFAASVVVLMLLGYWVDYHWRIENHWGLLIGTIIGVIGGTYNFVREAISAVREVNRQSLRQRQDKPKSDRKQGPGHPPAGPGPADAGHDRDVSDQRGPDQPN